MTNFYLFIRRYMVVFLMLGCVASYAQQRVTGKVTSAEDGSGVPGVNIIEKGTTNGTTTDFDGNYAISVGSNATLVFSFIGFVTQEASVGSRTTLDISLASDVTALSEVVVVGYGTQEKKEITSSVTSVKAADFNRGTVNDPTQLLQGKVAGLNITRPGGDPNGSFNVRLRGVSTVGANTEPLVVIDGVIGGSLSSVDPNDIASIDVLKDGSASAIYGTRGGSGVILITTKKGSKGKLQIDYNGSVASESIANQPQFANAAEYRQFPGAVDLGATTDWVDQVTEIGVSTVHNLSMSGGSQGTTYRGSVNFRDVGGIANNTGFQQFNTRLNLTQKALHDKATFTFDFSNTTRESNFGFTESLRYAVIANPTMPVFDNTTTSPTAGGNFGGFAERNIFDFFNPLSIAEQNRNEGKDQTTFISIRGEYDFSDIIEGLRGSISYSRQTLNKTKGEFYSKTAKFRGSGRNGLARRTEERNANELFEGTLNYDKTMGDLNVAILGGYSFQDFTDEAFGAEGGNFVTDAFSFNNLFAASDFNNGLGAVGSFASTNRLIAFFGRVNFNYKGNYFLSASVRREGSSRFGENNKWGTFPAVSGGATLSNLFEIPAVNSLKLRASWGKTGNQPTQSLIALQRFAPQGNFLFNGTFLPVFGPVSNANPDLQWETKNEWDIGADFAMLNNRLTGTVDYYNRTTSDLILPVNVPVPPNQFGTTFVNIGEIENSGFELALNYNLVQTTDFTYTPGFNFSTFSTTVNSLTSGPFSFGNGGVLFRANMGAPGQNDTRLVRVKEGDDLGQLWGPVQIGVNPDGTPQFQDINGDGSVSNSDDDKTVIGNGLPDFTFGFVNSFTYKNFDLNFLLRGAVGHDLLNSYRGFYENLESTTINNFNVVNTEFFDPKVTKASVNSTHVEDASFVRLDNATLGYTFKIKPGSSITGLRMYVSGQNLFTITDYTGVDPEVRFTDTNDADNGGRAATNSVVDLALNPGATTGEKDGLSPGIERRSTYFTSRILTFGVNLSF